MAVREGGAMRCCDEVMGRLFCDYLPKFTVPIVRLDMEDMRTGRR